MSDVVIVRRKVKSNFTVLDNAIFRDRRLSWKALGLLVWLTSLPPNFKLRLSHLASLRPTGRDATRSGLKELEECGYLLIQRERDVSGKFVTTTWVINDSPHSENPNVDKPKSADSKTENPTLINTKTEKETLIQTTTTLGAALSAYDESRNGPCETPAILSVLVALPPNLQQDILDEIEGKRRRGVLKSSPVALARYFAANPGKFVLSDGISVREERIRQRKFEEARQADAQRHEADTRKIESDLATMTEEAFEALRRTLPPTIKARITKRRTELRTKEFHE